MAEFIGRDEAAARDLLAAAGTRLIREDSPEREALYVEVLDEASRFDRFSLAVDAPEAGQESVGMGAWHTNAVNEFQSVASGEGILEFWTADGPVSVKLTAGDVMVNKAGVEHRYLPLGPQEWVIRFSGGPEAELVATDTGRDAGPWPL